MWPFTLIKLSFSLLLFILLIYPNFILLFSLCKRSTTYKSYLLFMSSAVLPRFLNAFPLATVSRFDFIVVFLRFRWTSTPHVYFARFLPVALLLWLSLPACVFLSFLLCILCAIHFSILFLFLFPYLYHCISAFSF